MRSRRWARQTRIACAVLAFAGVSSAFTPSLVFAQEKPLPPAPQYYVLDEPKVLTSGMLQALQALLAEHERMTGEQIVVAIFDSLGDEDVAAFTNRVFTSWRIGQRGKDNGALLALYWKDHKSRIEVGYGLEAILTDAKSKMILSEVLKPELQAGNTDRALSLATLEILRTIESPLIQDGKAAEILREGGLQGSFQPVRNLGGGWSIWLFVGLILLMLVLHFISAAEAHFTGDGWYKPRPNLRRWGRGPSGWGGGGGFGGSGGFGGGGGGFSGGGGMSGGGGASGDW